MNEIPIDDPERLQQRKAEAFQFLDFLGRVLSLMMRLAAPRMLARIPPEKLREGRAQALEHLDAYLARFNEADQDAEDDSQFARSEESARRVRALLESWSFSGEPPAALVQAARDFHTAFFGVSEPPGGWDAYDPSEEEA